MALAGTMVPLQALESSSMVASRGSGSKNTLSCCYLVPVTCNARPSASRSRGTSRAERLQLSRLLGDSLGCTSHATKGSPASRRLACRAAKPSPAEAVEEMEMIELDALERMDKSLEAVKGNFGTIRTGRAAPSILDRVEVEYYGTPVTLKSIAQVTAPDGSTILISPFDKSTLGIIEKALLQSDVGLTPSNDGNVIRLTVPPLTAERRKELVKLISKLSEEGKVALRNVRRDTIKAYEKMEKDGKISEDKVRDASGETQKLTDEYVKKVDALYKAKEKDILTV